MIMHVEQENILRESTIVNSIFAFDHSDDVFSNLDKLRNMNKIKEKLTAIHANNALEMIKNTETLAN